MPAIPRHATDTATRPWDGPRMRGRLREGEPASYYRAAFAWVDPDGDPETLAAYRFIHHEVDAKGNIGPANTRAASAGIGILNGGRGGTTIPRGDRQGVYGHLAAHLRTAELEVPDLRELETLRTVDYGTELRVEGEGEAVRLTGYTVEWDALSHELYPGLRERFTRGAFTKTLLEQDVVAVWQHDDNINLGRLSNGTLELREDERGLAHTIHPPDTQTVRDLVIEPIRRGDVRGMSFKFRAVRERFERESAYDVRQVDEAALFHVSPVNEPAYPQSSVQARSQAAAWLEGLGFDAAALDARDTDAIIEPEPRVVPRSVRERQLEAISRS